MANSVAQTSGNRPVRRFGLDFDNVFDDWFKTSGRSLANEDGRVFPAIDIKEKSNMYVVKADIPGVTQDDIDVSVSDGILTINAETRNESEETDDDDRVIRRERNYGKYVRSITLGTEVNEDNVKAKYKNGVLTLELPKAEATKPKRVKVDAS